MASGTSLPPCVAVVNAKIMPSKLGQNFLKDKRKLKKIIPLLQIEPGDIIFEIGAGHGELTDEIIKIYPSAQLFLLEKDVKLAAFLINKYKENKNIKIIDGDVLEELPILATQTKNNFKIIGNIPYYLTGKIFRTISSLETPPQSAILMVQKEVGERAVFQKDRFNSLSASIEVWGIAKIVASISRQSFSPVPKVDSVFLLITKKDQPLSSQEKEAYFSLLKIAFQHPRKTLLNNLSHQLEISKEELQQAISDASLPANSRPQNLDFESLLSLSKKLL